MALAQLLETLATRAPWLSVGRPILMRVGFAIHRGYEETIKSALLEPQDADREALLRSALVEYAVSGQKSVRAFDLGPKDRGKILSWMQGSRRHTSELTRGFPLRVSSSDLIEHHALGPQSLGKIDVKCGLAVAFSSSKSFLERVKVPLTSLKDSAREGFEELYGIQRVFVQCIDVIWASETSPYVYCLADLPDRAPALLPELAHRDLQGKLGRVLGQKPEPENLWPCIDRLYESKEGILLTHGFVNTKDAVKLHTSRKGGQSLWDDEYDKAGAVAVGDDLVTYRIGVGWRRESGVGKKAMPELELPGTASMLGDVKPMLDAAIVNSCLDTADLSFVLDRLESHMG